MVLAVVSFVLFLASILIYRTRAAANRWWFAILLTLLGSYLVLNVILIASNYFTGDGITDAVIYTVTSSLKGAGISKYVLPFIGLLAALGLIFAVLARSLLRRKAKGSSVAYSLVAVRCRRGWWPPNRPTSPLPISHSCTSSPIRACR